MRHFRTICIATASVLPAIAAPAKADELKFKPLIDARLRFEDVDQANKPNDAQAITLRARVGGEVSRGHFAVLAEAEGLIAIDPDYDSTTNGKSALYPVVADPQNVELNRAQFQYRSKPLTVTIGRQRINLDDQRFVGAVGWRQNEQTFDAARIEYSPLKNLKLDLTYAIGVQTIFGIDGGKFNAAQPTRIDGDNLFLNASYKFKPGTLTAFAYLIEADETNLTLLRNNDSQTYGARFAGAWPLSKAVKISYAASYAHQSQYAHSPLVYDADYAAAELGLEARGFKLTVGYELLGSDPSANGGAGFAFQTPLATLHKFNGWADKFLTTPATGLQDYYAGVGYAWPKVGKMGPLAVSFTFHRFDSDRARIHYGDEYDLQASLKVSKKVTAVLKYADYERQGIASFGAADVDTKKFWAQIDYIF